MRTIIDAILKLVAIALLIIGFLVIFKLAYEAITGEVLFKWSIVNYGLLHLLLLGSLIMIGSKYENKCWFT